jgi:hypothetical protein
MTMNTLPCTFDTVDDILDAHPDLASMEAKYRGYGGTPDQVLTTLNNELEVRRICFADPELEGFLEAQIAYGGEISPKMKLAVINNERRLRQLAKGDPSLRLRIISIRSRKSSFTPASLILDELGLTEPEAEISVPDPDIHATVQQATAALLRSEVMSASSRAEFFRGMRELTARFDGQLKEPIGFYREEEDGAFEIHYYDDELTERGALSREEANVNFVKGEDTLWHGHPNTSFEYNRENPVISKIEDGNPNKPSFADIIFNITQHHTTSVIAFPNGVLEMKRTNHALMHRMGAWMNNVGLKLSQPAFQAFSMAMLYKLMTFMGIESYNSENYMQFISALGFECRFYTYEDSDQPSATMMPDVGPMEGFLDYLNSERFAIELEEPMRHLMS